MRFRTAISGDFSVIIKGNEERTARRKNRLKRAETAGYIFNRKSVIGGFFNAEILTTVGGYFNYDRLLINRKRAVAGLTARAKTDREGNGRKL